MTRTWLKKRWLFPGLAAGVLALLSMVSAEAVQQPRSIQIGMAKSFLTDKPKSYVEIATSDFKEVLKKTSGQDGEVTSKLSASEIAGKLDKKQLDFGILHAHEFAWLQKKHPDLEAILIATSKQHIERAYLIVHKNSDIKSIADLQGKKLDMPIGTGEQCRLFVEKLCAQSTQKAPAAFFGSITKSASENDALDEVARNNVQAVVVDTFALEFYKEVKAPVFKKNLKVLQESERFPPAVIVCKKGALDAARQKAFRDGLLKAHTTPLGRAMMKAWNMDAFEPIPKDHDKQMAEVLKAFPPR